MKTANLSRKSSVEYPAYIVRLNKAHADAMTARCMSQTQITLPVMLAKLRK